jgi:2-polyprenyl-3-methyl-5-hydroxy-6-metoxy-1,4-benzoquinol methylase
MQWTPERISRFWDWQSQYPEQYFTYQFGSEIAFSLKPFLAGRKRILDYGCGVGYLLPHLCQYAPEVFGADPSEESVARTNERVGGTAGFKGAFLISELRRQQNKFDAILAIEVIEHLFDDELDLALTDVRELLSPGGVAIFSTPNNEDLSKSMILSPATGELFHRWQHVRSWSVDSLPERLRASGFTVTKTFETNMASQKEPTPVNFLKRCVKRLLLGDSGRPHLVCVAELAHDGRG